MSPEEYWILVCCVVYVVVARKLGARSRFERMLDLSNELSEHWEQSREIEGEEAALNASKLAKDSGASTEEAASLVEESRDSAIDEVKKQESRAWLLILIFVILYLGGLEPPGVDISSIEGLQEGP